MEEDKTPTKGHPECSAAARQTPDILHIDLPPADPVNVLCTISTILSEITTEHWENLKKSWLFCDLLTSMAFSCMDSIQIFAEAILDVILPQVYTHMRTHGTFSPTILSVSEDRIRAYMGDTIGQALTKCLTINVQDFETTKEFSELLVKLISKTVNSVLALTTQTPIMESKLPVIFISGCVSYIRDLKMMVSLMANILMEALNPSAAMTIRSKKDSSPIYCLNSRRDIKTVVTSYIIRMVRVLKDSKKPPCRISSSNHRDICIRVGRNTKILTAEETKSQGQRPEMETYSDLDSIPGVVRDTDKCYFSSDSCPFRSITVFGAAEGHSSDPIVENQTITNIAEELVEAFFDDLGEAADTVASQKTALQLEDVDREKIRKFTNRIFKLVMRGHDYQIPLVPVHTRMCDTVIYRRLRTGDITDPAIINHSLYLRTEEVVARCVVEVLLWLTLSLRGPDYQSPSPSLSNESDLFVPGNVAGDHVGLTENLSVRSLSLSSQHSIPTLNTTPGLAESPEQTQSQKLENIVEASLLLLLVGEMLTVIGIRNNNILLNLLQKFGDDQLQEMDLWSHEHIHVSVMGESYKDICQAIIADLLLDFGSLPAIQEAVRSGDPSFEEALIRALKKQMRILHEPAKKTTCSFFKKVKKLCCKTTPKKSSKTTTVTSLTPSDGQQQEPVRKEETLKEQTRQHKHPLMCRTAASIRKKCYTLWKRLSTFTSAVCRPFVTCCSPENE